MSYYLAAASACEGSADLDVAEERRRLTLRARLEESVGHAAPSVHTRMRQEINLAARERERALRDYNRAIVQRAHHDNFMASLQQHSSLDATPRFEQPPSVPVMESVDAFRRIRLEEERLLRMTVPIHGIAGLYNTMERPLAAAGWDPNTVIPTVPTLIEAEGKGVDAIAQRKDTYALRRRLLAEVGECIRRSEDEELQVDAQAKLQRDLQRYDEVAGASPAVVPPPISVNSDRNPFHEEIRRHPIDEYHSAIREEILARDGGEL